MNSMPSCTTHKALTDSIKKEGLLNPCVKQGDVLLDGRNRLAACKLAGVTPRFVNYTGDSPVAFIIAINLQRRHLDKGQKIALALDLEPLFAEEAKKRQLAAGAYGSEGGRGNKKENPGGKCPTRVSEKARNQPQSQQSGKVPPIEKAKSRDQAAIAVGLSGKLVSAAKAIKAADPPRFEKVKAGKLSIAKAKKEIKAEQDQRDLIEAQARIDAEKRRKIKAIAG